MKPKKLLIILLLIVLSAIPTSAETTLILKKGDISPYTGILMDEDDFRYFKARELEADNLGKAYVEYKKTESSSALDFALPLVFGLIFGGFVVDVIHRK